MIHLVTNRAHEYVNMQVENAKLSSLDEFITWTKSINVFQFDTETLFVEDSADVNEDRKLVLMQFGDVEKKDQWLIESNVFLTDKFKVFAKGFFEDENNAFISHNFIFEYTVVKVALEGIRVENGHCTFLMSQILNCGYDLEDGYHSYAGCVKRFFGIDLDKSEQTKFTFAPLTDSQITYSVDDIMYLYDLFLKLKELLISWGLWNLYVNVERHVLKVYADMTLNEMRFDTDHWIKLGEKLKEEDKQAEKELNELLFKDPKLVEYLKKSNLVIGSYLIQPKDQLIINWGSNVDRREILVKIIPDLVSIDKFTKPELNKLFKANVLSVKDNKLLKLYIDRNFVVLNRYLTINHRDWLYSKGYFFKKNDPLINWNSNVHKLYTFQFYYPHLQDTNAKTLNKIYTNPLISKFKQYVKIHKNVTTYGEGFIAKYVSRRGTISPRGCRSILTTGRISFGILLQMPSKAEFRNAFLPPEDDWVFVDSDYSSIELVYAAYKANEPNFLQAVREGKDAHSMSAAKLFKNEWVLAGDSDCIHAVNGKQCSCPGHKKMRTMSKTITFGLLFGSTYVGISERLNLSRSEAKKLVEEYFEAFPAFKVYFANNADYGMTNNRIMGSEPTCRIRFFHPPVNDGEKQAIGRASMNMPIQGDCASILKIALINLRRYIIDNNFIARLHLPVHDESLSSCPRELSEKWAKIQDEKMVEAANLFVQPGLIKTDTKILEKWTK